jgi:hypothetical protein
MNDAHNLNWYDHEARRFAAIVQTHFGVELDEKDIRDFRDAAYRAVINAKVLAQSDGQR